jgi:hypothetical protein
MLKLDANWKWVVNTMRQLLYLSGFHAKVPLYFGIRKKKMVTNMGLNLVVEN